MLEINNSKYVYFNNPNLSLVFNGIFLLLYKISFNSSNIPSLILSSCSSLINLSNFSIAYSGSLFNSSSNLKN